jgi:hypothetical protein
MTIMGGCVVLAVVGCGSVHATAPPPAATATATATATASAVAVASGRIPSAARAVTITAIPGLDATGRTPAPVTITSAAAVRRIASLVDGLPVFPPGTYNCPADTGRELRLTFRATAGGPALAVATAALDGCGEVGLTVGRATQPDLSDGPSLAKRVLAIAGLHWTGYVAGGSPGDVQIRP